jgi:sporulation-control protein spo0M
MSFLDSLKKAASVVTGGAAKVTLTVGNSAAVQGQVLPVVVGVVSTGAEVKHEGVYVDLVGIETITAKLPTGQEVSSQKESVKQSFKIAAAGTIAANQGQHAVGEIAVPANLPPTYQGVFAKHEITLVARVDMAGSDPSSAATPLVVLRKP